MTDKERAKRTADFWKAGSDAREIVKSWPMWKQTLFTDRPPINVVNPPKVKK